MTSEPDRALLLRLAREAISAHVGVVPAHVPVKSAVLDRLVGAFVTLHNHGDLRGCIGHIEPTEPLGSVVARCAVAACSSDPRFPRIAPSELGEIDIEISLLGPSSQLRGRRTLRWAGTDWSSKAAGSAASFCRRWRPSGAGMPRRSSPTPATKPACHATRGNTAR